MMECTMMMDGMGMMGMMGWGLLSLLFGLLVLFLFILAAAYGVKWVWGERSSNRIGSEESAFDILKKRYARGEISKEEFERIKKNSENLRGNDEKRLSYSFSYSPDRRLIGLWLLLSKL
jgi:putative membrane protein